MNDAIAAAIARIEANGRAHAERKARIASDARAMFLTEVCDATANLITAEGGAGFEQIVAYHDSAASIRHRRARELLFLRRARLANGRANTAAGRLAWCARLRREEMHRRGIAACEANLMAVDRALAGAA